MNFRRTCVLTGLLALASSMGVAAGAEKTLYERLGGQPAIRAVASGLVDRILLLRDGHISPLRSLAVRRVAERIIQ